MGFNSVVLILNDALDTIKKDPNLGDKIDYAIATHDRRTNGTDIDTTGPGFRYIGGMRVLGVAHADETQVFLVGQNSGKKLAGLYLHGPGSDEEKVMRALAEKLGYRVARKPLPKVRKKKENV